MSNETALALAAATITGTPAIIAAIIATRSASRIRAREIDAQRIRDLESRISERKYEVYKPMLTLLRDMFNKEKQAKAAKDPRHEQQFRSTLENFWIWITMYGSDEAIRSFHGFMQSTYSSAPSQILMRTYSDFVLAARRDIGYPDTMLNSLDFLGMRINDIYSNPEMQCIATDSFDQLCARFDWKPPWKPL